MKSCLVALSTPVTCAPSRLASWMANEPDPPPAPLMSTRQPGTARCVPCSAIAPACGMVDASANVSSGRLVGECGLRRDGVLREATHQREVVAVHLVAELEPGHPFADLVDHAGDVRSERPPGRGTQPTQPRVRGGSGQALPVAEVDRGRSDLDPHLARGRAKASGRPRRAARREARTGRRRPPSRPPSSAAGHGGNLARRSTD